MPWTCALAFRHWLMPTTGTRNCRKCSHISGIQPCNLRAAWPEEQARRGKKPSSTWLRVPAEFRIFFVYSLTGDFGIDEGNFKPRTQEKVNKLSAGARGEKGEEKDGADLQTVLTNLKGHVALSNGIAKFSHLSFTMLGASAQLDGSYNVITEKIDLHGVLRTDAELANTVHGPKALFLKVLDRFFKKKHAGYIAPVKITGTYDHPSFGLDRKSTRLNSSHVSISYA